MRKFNITVNGKSYEVDVEEIGGAPAGYVPAAPAAPKAAPAAPKAAPAAAPAASVEGASNVTAPMPGTIVSVKVKVGDTVKSGDLVCILEAMKMENEIFANADGKVVAVSASAGASVNSGDVLISIA